MKATEHQLEILKRDLDQIHQWKEKTSSDMIEEMLYDLAIFDAFGNIEESLNILRQKLANSSRTNK